MNSFTNDCEHVFHSVDSVHNHFIMDWKNALTHFETYSNKIADKIDSVKNITYDVFEEEDDVDTDEEDLTIKTEPEEEEEDFCMFQFEL